MALNSSGQISLGGATAGQSINLENGLSATAQVSLNDAAVRSLAGVASGAITMPTNFWGKSNYVPYSTKVTYTANTTLVAPYAAIRVKAWGAGGGGTNGGSGGGAGFAKADITVTAGDTLAIRVGGGGPSAPGPVLVSGGVNGGGGAWSAGSGNWAGGGGGYSGVFLNNTVNQANARVVAGGGGGAAGVGTAKPSGGAGGGVSGANGAGSAPGTGGTQSAGGSSGGSALQGGTATSAGGLTGKGGGGGGYFGGGCATTTAISAGSGGGGSGYVNGTSTVNTAGSGASVANSGDSDYVAGKGNGGGSSTAGQAGYVVIYY